jgi:hypothetical protein
MRVEVSGQLSNQATREEISALWALTRDTVSIPSLERTSPESQPVLQTPKRVRRHLDPAKVAELTAAYGWPSSRLEYGCEGGMAEAKVSDVDIRAGRVSPLPHPTDLPLGTCFKLAAEAEDLAQ